MSERSTPLGTTRIGDERDLQMVIELSPSDGCPLQEVRGSVRDVEIHQHEDGCLCDFLISVDEEEARVEHQQVTRDEHDHCECACRVFSDFGCVPHIEQLKEDMAVIKTFVADRDVAWDLLESLGTVCETVDLVQITNEDIGGLAQIAALDLSALSGKQKEAMQYAIEEGYYETGTNVPLGELAEELDISPSALSQRLKRAEENIMSQVFN